MFLMWPLVKIWLWLIDWWIWFFSMTDYWLKQEKSNKNKWNENTRSRKDRHRHDGCQWTPLFCPFPSRRGNPTVFVFFSLHQMNFVVDKLQRQEQFKDARASDWQNSNAPKSLSTKVLFHCLKNIRVCLKHIPCLWKGLSFPFGELICLTMSTFSGFSSSLVHKNWSIWQEPPWLLHILVYSRDEEKERDMTLCQTLTPRGPVLKDFKGTFCRSLQTMTPSAVCNFYFLVFWSGDAVLIAGDHE